MNKFRRFINDFEFKKIKFRFKFKDFNWALFAAWLGTVNTLIIFGLLYFFMHVCLLLAIYSYFSYRFENLKPYHYWIKIVGTTYSRTNPYEQNKITEYEKYLEEIEKAQEFVTWVKEKYKPWQYYHMGDTPYAHSSDVGRFIFMRKSYALRAKLTW